MRTTLFVLACLLVASVASAQVPPPDVNNPTKIEWTASADHATIDGYTLDILNSSNVVIQTLDLGKPAPDVNNLCVANLNVQPVTFGSGYYVTLRARANNVFSAATVSQNKFNRVPGAPTKPVVK
jgi:hypothetical protein